MISSSVNIPVIASGGAGNPEHLRAVLDEGLADAALVASITHYGEYTIRQLKDYLTENGIKVRTTW
jgi:cyclase